MRITHNSNHDLVQNSILQSKGRMEKLQREGSSLKKINTPSDDPVAAAKILQMRTEKENNISFRDTAKLAEAYLGNSDNALSQMTDLLIRAKEIAIGQSSGASSNEGTRFGISEEVSQLFKQAISIANTRVAGRYIFGGYKTNSPPVNDKGNYQGDDGEMMVEIAKDVFINMNVPGLEAFNSQPRSSKDYREGQVEGRIFEDRGPAGVDADGNQDIEFQPRSEYEAIQGPQNANVFQELQRLRTGLLTGDLDSIRSTLDQFDQLIDKVNAVRSQIGSRLQGIESTSAAMDRHEITNAQLTQNLEDADLTQVMADMANEETVLRSTMSVSQRLLQPTLMDFIK